MNAQFSLADLMLWTACSAVVFMLLSGETFSIGFGTMFCVISYVFVLVLGAISIGDLCRRVGRVFVSRSFRPLVSRIKWLILDTVILTWCLTTIPIANHVIANSTANANWLLLLGVVCSPLIAWRILHSIRVVQFARSWQAVSSDQDAL